MPALAEVQRLLWRLITAPEGVAPALAADGDGPALRAALQRAVRGDARLDEAAHVDIYANMYFYRLLDVIKDDYPAIVAVVGDGAFHNLITDYVLAYPPTHFSLRYAGARLPAFAAAHALGQTVPYLADLAAFEWALTEAFDAPDAPPLAAPDLAAIAPEQWASLCLRPHVSVRLLRSGWPVHRLRALVDRGDPVQDLPADPLALAVWRPQLGVSFRTLSEPEWWMLTALRDGVTFGDACALVEERLGGSEASAAIAAALAGWVSEGLLARLEPVPA